MHGTRIVDLSRVLAGPWATMHLADQGADVIKVEPPEGDETRSFGPFLNGESTYFASCNRNKRSIALDLKHPAGREVLLRLLGTADVLLHNFRPGVDERLGLRWDALHQRFPRLVLVVIHAFGDQPGREDRLRPGYDLVVQCMSGTVSLGGFPGSPPTRAGVSTADHIAGLLAVQGVLSGLLDRERTGEGQRVEVNMLHAQASTLSYHVTRYTLTGEAEERRGNAHAGLVPYNLYKCSDGWLAVSCGNDLIWQRLRLALDLPDEPAWRSNPGRVADRETLEAALEAALCERTVASADALLCEHGVPVGPVNDLPTAIAHPAVELVDVPHPTWGAFRALGPILHTKTTVTAHRAPPALGEHRDELLTELGLSAPDIAVLRARGAFGEDHERS